LRYMAERPESRTVEATKLGPMKELDDCIVAVLALVQDPFASLLPLNDPVPDVELRAVERELGVSLPRTYLAFLRASGSGWLAGHELYGLPCHGLWGDVVLINDLGPRALPQGFVKFSRDRKGRQFYFDTARGDKNGECPVAVLDLADGVTTVAVGFREYLQKAVSREL
jgi:hypothetical protein